MRALRIAAMAAIAAAATIAALRIAGLVDSNQMPWLVNRALGVIVVVSLAGIAVAAVAGRPRAADADRRVP